MLQWFSQMKRMILEENCGKVDFGVHISTKLWVTYKNVKRNQELTAVHEKTNASGGSKSNMLRV